MASAARGRASLLLWVAVCIAGLQTPPNGDAWSHIIGICRVLPSLPGARVRLCPLAYVGERWRALCLPAKSPTQCLAGQKNDRLALVERLVLDPLALGVPQ